MGQTATAGTFHAILVGIDFYFPLMNKLSGRLEDPSLGGCVRDVNYVQNFLEEKLGRENLDVVKLTASKNGGDKPKEPRDVWPTYENIVAAFRNVAKKARKGEQVYIHYSGHGLRLPTQWPEIKGVGAQDESLVPTNIASPDAQHLRDLEFSYLLKELVDKELIVSVILDSCHSGGATRGMNEVVPRELCDFDTTSNKKNDAMSHLASNDELAKIWSKSNPPNTRGLFDSNFGALAEQGGYVLLAACRPTEKAYEHPALEGERRGVFTYLLLQYLKEMGARCTYKTLHDRISARIPNVMLNQTPMIIGDANRQFFGNYHVKSFASVNVSVDLQNQFFINTGQVLGIKKGARFAIYPPGVTDFEDLKKRIAVVEVSERGATQSQVTIVNQSGTTKIPQGAQAVLLDMGPLNLEKKVHLVIQDEKQSIMEADQRRALALINDAIPLHGKGNIRLAAANEIADYQVAINSKSEYEIWDTAGNDIPNIRPPLIVSDNGAAVRTVGRLKHLAKYSLVHEIDNHDEQSPLAGKLRVELFGLQDNFQLGDKPQRKPLEGKDGSITVKDKQYFYLTVKNEAGVRLDVTLLDLAPDWSISIIRDKGGDAYRSIEPGDSEHWTLRANLPAGYGASKDILKVFATVGQCNFEVLELPSLDQLSTRSSATRSISRNSLESLIDHMMEDLPKTRNIDLATTASYEWNMVQRVVQIVP